MEALSANELLIGYVNGIFPMADADGTIYWYAPNPRAIIPIETYKSSKSLRPFINQKRFEVRVDQDFEGTMRACALPRHEEDQTWISEEIIQAYVTLHKKGFAHSIETYQNGIQVGGLYGVSIGGAFFGESMFYKVPNASKVAFHYLVELLKARNFLLLDSQFINSNVERFGAIEISKHDYEEKLKAAIALKRRLTPQKKAFDITELLYSSS